MAMHDPLGRALGAGVAASGATTGGTTGGTTVGTSLPLISTQTLTVSGPVTAPTGATLAVVKIWGGGGGGPTGGAGGFTTAEFAVVAGEVLDIDVATAVTSYVGGVPGGGDSRNSGGSGGGGYSAIWRGATPLALAGGGGGSGNIVSTPLAGGGEVGQAGLYPADGGPGTQSAGGAGGTGGDPVGAPGSYLQGGIACGTTGAKVGGGGGGGWYGGGGGGLVSTERAGGGGAGSGYVNATHTLTGYTLAGVDGVPPNTLDPGYIAGKATPGQGALVVIEWRG